MSVYLFDVDGTLTTPGTPMTQAFSSWLETFCKTNIVFLVSSSGIGSIRARIPHPVIKHCKGVFACMGAQYFVDERRIYSLDHKFSDAILWECQTFLEFVASHTDCQWKMQQQLGILTISNTVQASSFTSQRKASCQERLVTDQQDFARSIRNLDMGYEVLLGSGNSVNIVPQGVNKSIVMEEIQKRYPQAHFVFFGDTIHEGGSDYPLAKVLEAETINHSIHTVSNYLDTWSILSREEIVEDYLCTIGSHESSFMPVTGHRRHHSLH